MANAPLPSEKMTLTCTQCGGELHPDEGQIFIVCPYCTASVYLDKRKVVFHWSLAPTLSETDARTALARWMSGSQTVKDLDKKARVTAQTFTYFPLWYFLAGKEKREKVLLQPAAAVSVSELTGLTLPAGDLVKYDPALDSQAETPTVPLDAARLWALQREPGVEIRENSLVHVPLYIFKYEYKNRTYTAMVEAATGRVLANIFPAKAEAPYLMLGGVTAAVFLCLALLPLISGSYSDVAVGISLTGCVIAAPILFFAAVWVSSKI
jgi:DNA-directed RNA polymerase subunit RPC12/RpoP